MSTPTPTIPPTHLAIGLTSPFSPKPLSLVTLPTPSHLQPDEALIRVTHTGSSPLDLHRAAGGFLVDPNRAEQGQFILGTAVGGTVVALGEAAAAGAVTAKHDPPLRVGDRVVGFVMDGDARSAGFQEYAAVQVWRLSRVPEGMGVEEAVTVPANLVTAFHTILADLELPLPWPVPAEKERKKKEEEGKKRRPVLVWGAASSVGMYVVQVLRYWGYSNVWAVAAERHHEMLKGLGARVCFDYRKAGVVEEILQYAAAAADGNGGEDGPQVPFIVDCIGSRDGTLRPLSRIAEKGSRVAIMLPIINVQAAEGQRPEFEMDATKVLPGEWAEGVELRDNEFLRDHLQPEIIPELLKSGAIRPNKVRIVEGDTVLDRAQKALDLLRDGTVSGEKLVWRVAED
ncbi:hypothetical protein VTJ49DRAFT_1076 [Mycothermus thermophilus]|uniref:Enoyl reductase (ER) domain-containing protein n=1 Tax=Humicola insolens TaxID=85995 RepID=A0ABR3VDZ3_HUMIN